ncbi:M23 family metallopeptidase [Treponema parvum]|uniref:M23 family metallopeptidase n=1 Tax=Treponema parvum TaxID=138851 RepID=UPI001AEC60C3|nr:M23 family metallopeptidase [Treponema parvum]QTQ16476.1 M23 family metallopeptidase [Treponema parvum]
MFMTKKAGCIFTLFFILSVYTVCAADGQTAQSQTPISAVRSVTVDKERMPRIRSLSAKDELFKQYNSDTEQAYMDFAKNKKPLQSFYIYKGLKNDTLFAVASRCSIPYETLATVNSIEDQNVSLEDKELLLPTVAGIFVCDPPEYPFEKLLYAKNDGRLLGKNDVICYNIGKKRYYFFAQERFSPTERAFFLDSLMRIPVAHAQISSVFGKRISPISGQWHFHQGIDLVVPEGTDVMACKNATVAVCEYGDRIYGNYIILDHGGKITSIYAHLSQIIAKKGETVYSGQVIGKVGHTGMATGAHLHFEIRVNNVPSDPQKMIKK